MNNLQLLLVDIFLQLVEITTRVTTSRNFSEHSFLWYTGILLLIHYCRILYARPTSELRQAPWGGLVVLDAPSVI